MTCCNHLPGVGMYGAVEKKLPLTFTAGSGLVQVLLHPGTVVDWGDGPPPVTQVGSTALTHTYAGGGPFQAEAQVAPGSSGTTGYIRGPALLSVDQWGAEDLNSAFSTGATIVSLASPNLTAVPTQAPPGVTIMSNMFANAGSFNGDISGWDTSLVTNMSGMFQNATTFDQDISGWDVSAVSIMTNMFRNATAFNQDLSGWDTTAVTNMGGMFNGAASFNQDLSGWCVEQIPSTPSGFDLNATSWTLPRPVWGTCP